MYKKFFFILSIGFCQVAAAQKVVAFTTGLFANGMLLQRDADNFDFTVDCLRWLGQRPDKKPRQCTFDQVEKKSGSMLKLLGGAKRATKSRGAR